MKLDTQQLQQLVNHKWDEEIIPALSEYIKVPAKSPNFDANWAKNGFIDQVVNDAVQWVKAQNIQGLRIEVVRLNTPEGRPRTPVIFFEVDAFNADTDKTVFMYGHLDKQPEASGWSEGLGPWVPKVIDDKLYGRGGADDGYAIYTSVAILQILQKMKASHPRIIGLFECCEESGSFDLPFYFEALRDRMGDVSMVVCLDSGAANYEQLWMTDSLRGAVAGILKVEVANEGIHSGDASGIVPSSMRIMRQLFDRLEDQKTGQVLPAACQCDVPPKRLEGAKATATILGDEVVKRFPWADGADGSPVHPVTSDPLEAYLNRSWRATLCVTGVEGIPSIADAGNVLRPYTAYKISIRMPPIVNSKQASVAIKDLLEENPPYNAKVTFAVTQASQGWSLQDYEPWLESALEEASQTFYGAPCGYNGQGGSIPLINMLQENFPAAQMLVCGVLGPNSNAHGPNEFIHLGYVRKLTACLAMVLAKHP